MKRAIKIENDMQLGIRMMFMMRDDVINYNEENHKNHNKESKVSLFIINVK